MRQARDKGPEAWTIASWPSRRSPRPSPRVGAGPAGPRRRRVASPGPHGRPRIGGKPALHRRAGEAHPGRRPVTDWEAAASSSWRPCSGANPGSAHRRPAAAGGGRGLRAADPESLAFQAAELGAGGRVALASLRSARLIRCSASPTDEIEIYHDRIRETVVPTSRARPALVPRTACCALEVSGPADPEVLAGHFLGAGDRLRARLLCQAPTRPRRAGVRSCRAALSLAIELDCTARRGRRLGRSWATRWPTPAGGRGRRGLLKPPRRPRPKPWS